MIALLILVAILLISWLAQAALTMIYHQVLSGWQVPLLEDAQLPPAVVVLCLRGGDPFLSQCIDGLLTQEYPGYRVRFMVDSEHDPSLPIVRAGIARHRFERYEILTLADPLSTCGLKCSGLAQAIGDLIGADSRGVDSRAAEPGFVALLDADTIPHRSWLRELATGLAPEDVGAVTGNRWYMPDSPTLGALTRHLWNAAAIVQMYVYKIAWGGTLAIKLDSIRRADLLASWCKALCEDTMTHEQLAMIGQRLVFVPSLMMVNREDVSLARLTPWIGRQLLTTRLYHPHWSLVLLHGILSALLPLSCLLTSMWFAWQGNWLLAVATLGSLLLYQVALMSLLPWIARPIESILQARGESTNWQSQVTWFEMFWGTLVTQWIYTQALISCQFTRQVQWRGIDYRVDGRWQIRMLGYKPYQPEPTEMNESL